jgi:hypothetical protein
MTAMSKLSLVVLAMIGAVSPVAVVTGSGVARADVQPGQQCYILHVTAQDANGRTMWCNPTMTTDHTTGQHNLVWQYGGPG